MLSLKPKESSEHTHRVKMSQVTESVSPSRREETGSCFCAALWGPLLQLGSGGAGLTQGEGLCWERTKGPNHHHLGVWGSLQHGAAPDELACQLHTGLAEEASARGRAGEEKARDRM